jgi:hypothetical protein
LSNDKRSIYSEFKVKVLEVVKATGAMSLRADDSIEIQRKGGAIRLRSGKVLVRGALADSMPQIGKRYLLFLKYNQDTDDFAIVTGYQLDGNDVYRLDDLSYRRPMHTDSLGPGQRPRGLPQFGLGSLDAVASSPRLRFQHNPSRGF